MSTRSLSALVSASCLFLLIACGKKEEAPPKADAGPPAPVVDTDAEKVVNVYNWSDYIEPTVLDDFTKETGVKVNYEVMDSNELLETKLVAGRTGYDVVVPSASFLARQIKSGIYQKLDKSKLPNLKNLDPDITKRLEVFDPGNEHAVNYMWGTSGVAYNEEAIKAAMPDAPVDSFAMFWDPKVVSKFAKCGVSVLDAPVRSRRHGADLPRQGRQFRESGRPQGRGKGAAVGAPVHPHSSTPRRTSKTWRTAKSAWRSAGRATRCRPRAARKRRKKPFTIKYNIPKEGAVMFFDNMAIPADASHVKNAHLFIDYMLRPEVAAKNSNFISFANSNAASWPLVSRGSEEQSGHFPDAGNDAEAGARPARECGIHPYADAHLDALPHRQMILAAAA